MQTLFPRAKVIASAIAVLLGARRAQAPAAVFTARPQMQKLNVRGIRTVMTTRRAGKALGSVMRAVGILRNILDGRFVRYSHVCAGPPGDGFQLRSAIEMQSSPATVPIP